MTRRPALCVLCAFLLAAECRTGESGKEEAAPRAAEKQGGALAYDKTGPHASRRRRSPI